MVRKHFEDDRIRTLFTSYMHVITTESVPGAGIVFPLIFANVMEFTLPVGGSASFTDALARVIVACGGKQTMASKSAAAYDEARKKGLPVSAGEHGGHEAGTAAEPASPASAAASEHGSMPGMDHSGMPGMRDSGGNKSQHEMAGMDHSSMAGMDHAQMSGMQHGSAGQPHDMGAMQHGSMAGMQHGSMTNMQHGSAAPLAIAPPTSNSAIAQTQPASTLRQDEFDAPAPSAVDEAAKAAGVKPPPPKPPSHEHRHDGGEEPR